MRKKQLNFKQAPDLPKLEEETQQFWQQDQTFKKSVENKAEDKAYVFYDGPPFATGMPHYGHLLASTTKDVIPRYWTMKGFRVNRVWGWDCHGLPIENMIEQKLKIKGGKKGIEELGIDKFNQSCRTEVLRLDKEWEKIINRLGRWVDFEHNYKTMDSSYMESVWWGFKQLFEKNLIYKGRKVVLFCPRCATPLSNFEIAMDNSYEDVETESVYVKFAIKNKEKEYLLAWTTTPWTLPGNVALAVNSKANYTQVELENGEKLYLAEKLLEKILNNFKYKKIKNISGKELVGLEYEPLYPYLPTKNKKAFYVTEADFVTLEDGTGIVHTAAIYGEDDYQLAQEKNLPCEPMLDDEGKFMEFMTPWQGMFFKKANPEILADLKKRGLSFKTEKITHSYPHCYRCHTPLFYNAVPAWFIDVQKLKQELITNNEKINWYPEHLKHGRFLKGLETAPDWNISRSRYWGTPMPIWENEKTGKRRIIGSIAELKKWAVDPKKAEKITDIHREYLDDLEVWIDQDKKIKGKRIPEVFDCWVESGSMPFASIHYPFENKNFFEANFPAQFVSEYIAQTRAWFYCMHVISTGIFEKPPFENVLTTGTIMAEDGSKMSKSKKNYPDPMLLINQYGVDSLRLYLMSSTVMKGENLNFSQKEVADIRRKVFVIWWNMLSFYQTFANNSQPITTPENTPEHVMDKWLLSKINNLILEVTGYMDNYNVVKASRTMMNFVDEFSTWYLRLSRERLRQADNQEASQIFGFTLYTLAQLIAPFAPFFSELVHHVLIDEGSSIHLTNWPKSNEALIHPELETKMLEVKKVVELARAERQQEGVKLRQPLAGLSITSAIKKPKENLLAVLAQECNVKQINWQKGEELAINLDFKLTTELKAEGEAREIIRTIQNLRKKAGLSPTQQVAVALPSWPENFEKEIKAKTMVNKLVKGSSPAILS